MKKVVVIIIMFLIILNSSKNTKEFTLLKYFSGDYVAYTSSSDGENCIDLGFCYINSNPVRNCVIGESITIENCEVSTALEKLNARVIKTEFLDDGATIIYAFTSLIDEKVDVFGKNVNLQIAIRDNITKIGWPLILGSF